MKLHLDKAWLRAADEKKTEGKLPMPTANGMSVLHGVATSNGAATMRESTWWQPMTGAQAETLDGLAHGRVYDGAMTRGEASLLIEEWGGPTSLNFDRVGVREKQLSVKLGSGCTKAVVVTTAGRCLVSVSKRTVSAPGAACARYHERDGVEILHDDDIAEWKGDRYSVIVAPEAALSEADMHHLAEQLIEDFEWRYGNDFKGAAWMHHERERDATKPDHLHLAVHAAEGRVIVTQSQMESSVREAVRALERERSKERGRG
jgi:hypothetical protein